MTLLELLSDSLVRHILAIIRLQLDWKVNGKKFREVEFVSKHVHHAERQISSHTSEIRVLGYFELYNIRITHQLNKKDVKNILKFYEKRSQRLINS